MAKTRVKNGKKQGSAKARAIKYYERGGMTTADATKRFTKEFRTFSAKFRNYKKVTKTTETAGEAFLRYQKYGKRDDLIREILKMPTTNPKVSKEEAGGDIERYSKTTLSAVSTAAANAYLNSFVISIQTAGKGSKLRRIWEDFIKDVRLQPSLDRLKAATSEKAIKEAGKAVTEAEQEIAAFWAEFDKLPRGFVSPNLIFPATWGITEKQVEKLVQDIKKWSDDYRDANRGGCGAGADRGFVSPTTGS